MVLLGLLYLLALACFSFAATLDAFIASLFALPFNPSALALALPFLISSLLLTLLALFEILLDFLVSCLASWAWLAFSLVTLSSLVAFSVLVDFVSTSFLSLVFLFLASSSLVIPAFLDTLLGSSVPYFVSLYFFALP